VRLIARVRFRGPIWPGSKCRVSGCSLRIAECSSHIRSIQDPFTTSSTINGVGGARDKELVAHRERARARSYPPPRRERACVRARERESRSPALPGTKTRRQIDPFTFEASFSGARVVARKRVPIQNTGILAGD
jgi:hypothetical protein